MNECCSAVGRIVHALSIQTSRTGSHHAPMTSSWIQPERDSAGGGVAFPMDSGGDVSCGVSVARGTVEGGDHATGALSGVRALAVSAMQEMRRRRSHCCSLHVAGSARIGSSLSEGLGGVLACSGTEEEAALRRLRTSSKESVRLSGRGESGSTHESDTSSSEFASSLSPSSSSPTSSTSEGVVDGSWALRWCGRGTGDGGVVRGTSSEALSPDVSSTSVEGLSAASSRRARIERTGDWFSGVSSQTDEKLWSASLGGVGRGCRLLKRGILDTALSTAWTASTE
jgi:hypothetical protein